MTKHDPNQNYPDDALDTYRDQQDDDEGYTQWVESWEEDERPTFTNGWRYFDHGAMPTIPPVITNTEIRTAR